MPSDPGQGGADWLATHSQSRIPPLLPRAEAAAASKGNGGQHHHHTEDVQRLPRQEKVN